MQLLQAALFGLLALATRVAAQEDAAAATPTPADPAATLAPTGTDAAAAIVGALPTASSAASVPVAANATATVATTTGVRVAEASATVVNSGANPLIPTSISASCQLFLEELNADSTFSNCTTSLLSTVALFAPSSTSAPGAADITTSLNTLCAAEAARCPSAYIRSTLNAFQQSCTSELQTRQPTVLGIHDVLYTLTPFMTSMCTKGADGAFCVLSVSAAATQASPDSADANVAATLSGTGVAANATAPATAAAAAATAAAANTTATAPALVARSPSRFNFQGLAPSDLFVSVGSKPESPIQARAPGDAFLPNTTTFSAAGLPFMFLSSSLPASVLCTNCTQSVLSTYIAWETRQPYPLGLRNSLLLSGQRALWAGVAEKCGSEFLTSVNQEAGQPLNLVGRTTPEGKTGAAAGALRPALGAVVALLVAGTALL